MEVFTPVSSRKTKRLGSMPAARPRKVARLCWTSGRSCSAACMTFFNRQSPAGPEPWATVLRWTAAPRRSRSSASVASGCSVTSTTRRSQCCGDNLSGVPPPCARLGSEEAGLATALQQSADHEAVETPKRSAICWRVPRPRRRHRPLAPRKSWGIGSHNTIIRSCYTQLRSALARFRTEAEAIARLQHPHIVQIHEVGEQGGLPYFSLEFCGGGSLEKKLVGTPLPPSEAAALVETLARAMQAAHEPRRHPPLI